MRLFLFRSRSRPAVYFARDRIIIMHEIILTTLKPVFVAICTVATITIERVGGSSVVEDFLLFR